MMRSTARVLLPLLGTVGVAGALEADFDDLRLSLGECEGYTTDSVVGSAHNGAADPTNDGHRHLRQRSGVDAEAGCHLGAEMDGGFGLTFGMDFVFRTPGADYDSSVDTGVASGSGVGDIVQHDHLRIRTMQFGAKFSAGVFQVFGPLRLELTPTLGVGSVHGRFQQSRVFDNDPTGLLAAGGSNASWGENAPYFDYGLTAGLYLETVRWLLVGIDAGYLGSRTHFTIEQHGPVFDQSQNRLIQSGWVATGSLLWSF